MHLNKERLSKMGYNIKVDHSKFEETAVAIEDYLKQQDSYMGKADMQIQILLANFQGEDANALKAKWDAVSEEGSITSKMKNSLQNYATSLRYAAKQYKDAQASAINEANRLPRW